MSEEKAIATKDNKVLLADANKALSNYIEKNIVSSFANQEHTIKLTIINTLAAKNIKKKKVGGIEVAYIEHTFARKALNFLFNFDIGDEVVRTEFYSSTVKTSKGDTVLYECKKDVRFNFLAPNGNRQTREVTGTGKAYLNAATSRFEVEKMALSNAWSLMLQSFGVTPRELGSGGDYYQAVEEPAEHTGTAPIVADKLNY